MKLGSLILFFQIYLQNLKTGKRKKLSPGYGKTTCSWSYDKHYDIFSVDKTSKKLTRLSFAQGYDAEASYSPNGKYIAFASNRLGYTQKLSPKEQRLFNTNSSYMMDIYIMDEDGKNIKQLTTSKGYDGGPFFSPDGKRILWRKFSVSGKTAEIYTMNIDGSDKKQLTKLNAMSWTPFYHPSGDYIIFTTNLHGHRNFELYSVDIRGTQKPKRVSFHPGFDGFPVFHPKGKTLCWTTQKSRTVPSQVYTALWDDHKARKLLNLPLAEPSIINLSPQISQSDLKKEVFYLSSKKLQGRATGSAEEKVYTKKIANLLQSFGLRPAGDNNTYFQKFSFVSSIKVNPKKNALYLHKNNKIIKLRLKKDWLPLSFSGEARTKKLSLVFAGCGIKKHKSLNHRTYNSYRGLDVKNKWVVSFRFIPENLKSKQKQDLKIFSQLSYKASIAKQLGAKGIIFISGPTSQVKKELISLEYKAGSNSKGFSVISVSDKVGATLLDKTEKELKNIQVKLDSGKLISGFNIPSIQLQSQIQLNKI